MKLRPGLALLVTLAAAAVAVPLGSPARAGTPLTGAGACPMFPADNVWNADISSLPVDPHSAVWLASMNAGSAHLHPDFGPSFGAQPVPYGIPYTVVTDAQPKVPVAFQYADESDPGPYPFSASTAIEGGPDATGDRHAIMVDATTCTLYELYDAQYAAAGSTAGSGAIWNLRSDALRPAGWTSADAAGLPILPGLVRLDEVAAGVVSHAIRFTAARTDQRFIWPARHEAGSALDPNLPPMGARFRLKAGFDISGYLPSTRVILRAMQHYGLILADNGSNWYFQGTDDGGWDNSMLDQLKSIPASAFEVVDESSLMVSPNSGQARQAGSAPGSPSSPSLPSPSPSKVRPAPPATPAAPPTRSASPSPAAPSPSALPGPSPSALPGPNPSALPGPSPSPDPALAAPNAPSPGAAARPRQGNAGMAGYAVGAAIVGGLLVVAWGILLLRRRSARHRE